MKRGFYETIIIGGGMAGLGCARQLQDHKKEFLVISKDIGGRVVTSEDGKVNYGAMFILDNYYNIRKYVEKTRKLNIFQCEFHEKGKGYFLIKSLVYPLQLLKLILLTSKFKRRYDSFKKECEFRSQKEVIESDPYLYRLYMKKADEFIEENKIREISKHFFSQPVYTCTFLPLSHLSAFEFMHVCLGLIVPISEFNFLKDKLIHDFEKKIIFGEVYKIKNGEKLKSVLTNNGEFKCKNLVIATPAPVAKKLIGLKRIKKPVKAYVFHVSGDSKRKYRSEFEIFNSNSKLIFIRKQIDSTYLVYATTDKLNFENYFTSFKILKKLKWDPAFSLAGRELIESKRGKSVYVIGDHNVCGIEDAYITGLYAANQIIKLKQKQ